MRLILIVILNVAMSFNLFGQTEIRGTLIDSVYNRVLPSASVFLYVQGESTVVKVSLTNKFGDFTLSDPPTNTPLLVEFSYQGFAKFTKKLYIQADQVLELGKIHLKMRSEEIEAVEILPPVRMNGDTIEFNADYFKLDSNAVVEDLLHKLPGMVVWGDGKVTYNGREIPTVLVNGKPFFGSEKVISLQNITKDAINKLQVYDTRPDQLRLEAPNDPTYEMNLVLKDGKEKMYFGNASAGIGTNERHDGQLNFNYADLKSQVSLASSTNNTNKKLNSIDQLLRNTTFKGSGVRKDFAPDFLRTGIHGQQVIGARYQYDFLGLKETNRSNLIQGSILLNNQEAVIQDSTFTTFIGDGTSDSDQQVSRANSTKDEDIIEADFHYFYNDKWKKRDINVQNKIFLAKLNSNHSENSIQIFRYVNNESINTVRHKNQTDANSMEFETIINIGAKHDNRIQQTVGNQRSFRSFVDNTSFDVRAKLIVSDDRMLSAKESNFSNFLDTSLNRITDRRYRYSSDKTSYNLNFTMRSSMLSLEQLLEYQTSVINNLVEDANYDKMNIHDVLTHQSRFKKLSYAPSVQYDLSLHQRHLTGRKRSDISATLKAGARIHNEINRSSLNFRNLEQRFVTFLPVVRVNQSFSKLGRFTQNASVGYRYDELYPLLDQLRPFYDNLNPSYRYFGARNLEKTKQHSLNFDFSFRELKENGYNATVNTTYKIQNDGWSDSIINVANQQQHYTVKIKQPTNNYAFNITLDRSFPLKGDQRLTFEFRGNASWSDLYQYINSNEQHVFLNSQKLDLDLHYSYNDKFVVGNINNWTRYFRNTHTTTNSFVSRVFNSGISFSYAITKKWNIYNLISNRFSWSSYRDDHSVIWNANTAYRFTKRNNLEIKISFYDILKQNKPFYFNNGPMYVTNGYRNSLMQYILFSISYYPRRFGI